MARNKLRASALADHEAQIVRLLDSFSHRHRRDAVFSDFVEMGAMAYANRLGGPQYEAREARYMSIVKKYTRDEVNAFCEMLALLHKCYQDGAEAAQAAIEGGSGGHATAFFSDVLGMLYMSAGLGNDRTGQFFTPYSLSYLMGKLNFPNKEAMGGRAFFRVHEPAVGAGGMVIAMADAMAGAGVNYQQRMHADCIDVDIRCVHMCYLQCCLLHIPAVIWHGNSLTMEMHSRWETPAHVLGRWSERLRFATAMNAAAQLPDEREAGNVAEVPQAPPAADDPATELYLLKPEAPAPVASTIPQLALF